MNVPGNYGTHFLKILHFPILYSSFWLERMSSPEKVGDSNDNDEGSPKSLSGNVNVFDDEHKGILKMPKTYGVPRSCPVGERLREGLTRVYKE